MELNRHPHLKDRPALIVDRSRGRPLVADRFPAAAGVSAGMTLEQARSRHAGSSLLEADEPAYRRVFHRMLASLQGVSDRVEADQLGHGLRPPGRAGRPVRRRGPGGQRPAELGTPAPGAPGRSGRCQVPRPRGGPGRQPPGGGPGPAGRRRLPGAPPGGPPAHCRRGSGQTCAASDSTPWGTWPP